ncbi:uncharacterized protein LOC127096438 [Lathyrus oleraceus]|uniref:uncharacterized protein LOC127096438 n=1 Tax=Pisum sativum TaxID=3888 RepID=UPI0021CE95E9|nr:uncharacterized protein LOC127096438 [Pisum sativum]
MSTEHIFEIRHLENVGDKFSVNLQDHSYTCRKWQLTALPCVHAISSMKSGNFKVESYIPDMYKKGKYQEVYNHVIYPVNDSNLWERTVYNDVQPPVFRKMPGKPKKKRNLEQGEVDGTGRKLRRNGLHIKCSKCKKIGHNKLTCKYPPTQSQAQAQGTQAQSQTQLT